MCAHSLRVCVGRCSCVFGLGRGCVPCVEHGGLSGCRASVLCVRVGCRAGPVLENAKWPAASRCPQIGRGRWGAMPAALPSRAAADGLARPVGRRGWVTWDMPEGCNSPKVHGSSRFLSSGNPTCSSCSVVYSLLSLSLSLAACSPPPTASSSSSPGSLACGMPGGPCRPPVSRDHPCMPEARDPR